MQIHSLPDVLVLAGLLPRLLGARVLLDLQECMPEFFATKFGVRPTHPVVRLLERLEQGAIALADHVITPTDQMRATFIGRGAAPERITTVMDGADPAVFVRPAAHRSGAGAGFGPASASPARPARPFRPMAAQLTATCGREVRTTLMVPSGPGPRLANARAGSGRAGLITVPTRFHPAVNRPVLGDAGRVRKQRRQPLHPRVRGDVINLDTTPDLAFRCPGGQAVAQVPVDGEHDHVGREPRPSEHRIGRVLVRRRDDRFFYPARPPNR